MLLQIAVGFDFMPLEFGEVFLGCFRNKKKSNLFNLACFNLRRTELHVCAKCTELQTLMLRMF